MSNHGKPPLARLFLALELPESLREELAGWARHACRAAAGAGERGPASPPESMRRRRSRRGAEDRHGIRLLDPETLHITIAFLGARPPGEIEPLAALLESLPAAAIGASSLGAPLWLPKRRPRALAVEVHDDSETMTDLHAVLTESLRSSGLATADAERRSRHRPLRPHVTVARMRSGAAPLERTLTPTPQRSFAPTRLVLYRSWLAREGASYEELAALEMAPAAG